MAWFKKNPLNVYDSFAVRVMHMYVALSASSIIIPDSYKDNPLYYISGFAAAFIGRVLDHMSTIPCIKLINTKEFREKNLGKKFYETNPFSGKHPTMKQYIIRNIPQDLFLLGFSALYPPAGYAFLSLSPVVYINNTAKAKDLENLIKS